MNRYRESSYRHFQSAENLNRLSGVENHLYRPSPAWSSQLSLTGQQEGCVEVVRDVVGQVQLRQLCKPIKSKVGDTHNHVQNLYCIQWLVALLSTWRRNNIDHLFL